MASYGNIFQFTILSQNGDDVDIFISKKNYSGPLMQRPLGRAPILKREANGNILGTSLEIYAECRSDQEYAGLYTSSADEFLVELYKNRVLQWTGFISPELYAEPDLAPPYDVQIIATDGLGELKNYAFTQEDNRPKSYLGHLRTILQHTGSDLEITTISSLQYSDDEEWSGNLLSIVADFGHLTKDNAYSALQTILASVNATITQQAGKWLIVRSSDIYDHISEMNPVQFGSMNSCDWWPIGNLSTDIIPAKRHLILTSSNAYKPTVLQNSLMESDESWVKEFGARYDDNERAFILPAANSGIVQSVSFEQEVGYQLFLRISARNIGDSQESQVLGVSVKIDGRTYQAGNQFWLTRLAGFDSRYVWRNYEGYIEIDLPEPSASDTRSDASNIDIVIPLYKYDSRSYAYATAVEVRLFNPAGLYDIGIYECSLMQYAQTAGKQIEVAILNNARENANAVELGLGDGDYAFPAAEVFRYALPLGYNSESIIRRWRTSSLTESGYMPLMARDYAVQVAKPRIRYRGKLNVPSSALPNIPLLFQRDNTYYILNTYAYDLLLDEIEVELISIPNATVAIESERVEDIASGAAMSNPSGGAAGSGGGAGAASLDAEMSDESENAVRNKVIKAYVDNAVEDCAKLDDGYVAAKGIVDQDDVYYHLPNNAPENDADHTLATQGWVKDNVTGITVDSVLSEESVNPVQNKVITEALTDHDTRISDMESFFAEGAKLNLRINSNQDNDSVIAAVKATIAYDDEVIEAGAGTIGLPPFKAITVTFPDVEGYKTPDPITFETGAVPVSYSVTYETEVARVSLSAYDDVSVIGATVIINGTSYVWNGTIIEHKIPYGVTYKAEATTDLEEHIRPEETFTASQPIREIYLQYSAMVGSWIVIDQTITDPATMISGDVNGEHIQLIRNNSHRYLGKYTAEGTMTICQLDDSNSNYYVDGTTAADLTGAEGDVFMRLPRFFYIASEKRTDVWKIGFYYGDTKPNDKWKEWDGNDLIGVTKARIKNDRLYSVIGNRDWHDSATFDEIKAACTVRGLGFSPVKWKHHCIMAILFYAYYGNTNSAAICGIFNSPIYDGSIGMADSTPTSSYVNFWGLAEWWGIDYEFIDGIYTVRNEGIIIAYITSDNGEVRTLPIPDESNYCQKLIIGEEIDILSSQGGGTATTGYCDVINNSSSRGYHLRTRSGAVSYATGGVAASFAEQEGYSASSRLAFRGILVINNDSTAFKSLTAIG